MAVEIEREGNDILFKGETETFYLRPGVERGDRTQVLTADKQPVSAEQQDNYIKLLNSGNMNGRNPYMTQVEELVKEIRVDLKAQTLANTVPADQPKMQEIGNTGLFLSTKMIGAWGDDVFRIGITDAQGKKPEPEQYAEILTALKDPAVAQQIVEFSRQEVATAISTVDGNANDGITASNIKNVLGGLSPWAANANPEVFKHNAARYSGPDATDEQKASIAIASLARLALNDVVQGLDTYSGGRTRGNQANKIKVEDKNEIASFLQEHNSQNTMTAVLSTLQVGSEPTAVASAPTPAAPVTSTPPIVDDVLGREQEAPAASQIQENAIIVPTDIGTFELAANSEGEPEWKQLVQFAPSPIPQAVEINDPQLKQSLNEMFAGDVELQQAFLELKQSVAVASAAPPKPESLIKGSGDQIMPYNEDLKALQTALNIRVDGREGPETRGAIEKYVAENKLDLATITQTDLLAHIEKNPLKQEMVADAKPLEMPEMTMPDEGAPLQKGELTQKFETAADYSGLNFADVKVEVKAHSRENTAGGLKMAFEAPAEYIDRKVNYDTATYTLAEQTEGIKLKTPDDNAADWAKSVANDPVAASNGYLEIGDGGKLLLTRVDEKQGLITADITKYVRDNGVDAIGLDKVPFRLEGEQEMNIGIAFSELSRREGFDEKVGMVMKGEGNLLGKDAQYQLLAYQDDAGEMQIRLVSGTEDTRMAARQTPQEIQNIGNDFAELGNTAQVAAYAALHDATKGMEDQPVNVNVPDNLDNAGVAMVTPPTSGVSAPKVS